MDEAPNFLTLVPSETMHAIQIENTFDATHLIIIPLKLNGVPNYVEVRKPAQEDHEYLIIVKIEVTAETPPWDPSSSDYKQQKQSMINYRGRFVSPNTPAREQLYINSVILYAYDAADVIYDDNYATVLDSYVTTSALPVAKVSTKKVLGLNHLALAKSVAPIIIEMV